MKNSYEIRGDKVTIFLKRRDGTFLETSIDIDDFNKVNSVHTTWSVRVCKYTSYVFTRFYVDGKSTTIHLHRLITDCPDDLVVDHLDGNGLNNERSNLKVKTQSNNMHNRVRPQSTNKSGIRGVHFEKQTGKWRATIKNKGKAKHLGRFSTKEQARIVVEKEREKYLA